MKSVFQRNVSAALRVTVGLVSLLALQSNVGAQSTPDLLRPRFQADATRSYLVTPAAEVNDRFGWNVGLLAGYAHEPLRLVDGGGDPLGGVVDQQFYGSLGASIVAARRLQLGLDLPLAISQSAGSATPTEVSGTAVGDLRAQAVVNVFSTREQLDDAGAALGVIGEMYVPTGDGASFTGGALRGGGGLVFEVFANARTHFALAAIYRAAPTIVLLDSRLDDSIQWSLAGERRIRKNWSVVGDLVGEVGTGADGEPANQRPLELLVAGRWHNSHVYTQLGGGPGLSRGVGTPVFRVFAGFGVTPRGRRWDGEETVATEVPVVVTPVVEIAPVPVAEPECTTEDVSRCEVPPAPTCEDGAIVSYRTSCEDSRCENTRLRSACPAEHACQLAPDGTAACVPVAVHVPTAVVDDTLQQIVINEVIQFEFDSDVIDPVSFPILDRVAEVILRETVITSVSIEGHTDFMGSDQYNQDLSDRRARSVLNALVQRGVDRQRLRSAGFGESRPLDPAETDAARARNRRVEFHFEVAL